MSGLPFNLIDISFIAILVISGVLAYLRGFVREFLSVAAWAGATFATLYGYPHIEPYARELIGNRMLADVSAGLALFVVTLTALSVAAHFAARKVRDSAAGGFDRSMGFVFGIFRGVILVSLLFLSATWFWGQHDLPKPVRDARTYPLIEGSTAIILALMIFLVVVVYEVFDDGTGFGYGRVAICNDRGLSQRMNHEKFRRSEARLFVSGIMFDFVVDTQFLE